MALVPCSLRVAGLRGWRRGEPGPAHWPIRPARAGRIALLWARRRGARRHAQHGPRRLPSACHRPGAGLPAIGAWVLGWHGIAGPPVPRLPAGRGAGGPRAGRRRCCDGIGGGNTAVSSASRCRTPGPEYPAWGNRAEYCWCLGCPCVPPSQQMRVGRPDVAAGARPGAGAGRRCLVQAAWAAAAPAAGVPGAPAGQAAPGG
jgi:hypothetical protein